ncbi:MAG: hypothetical protein KME26_27445 [Oscillatoria princeps RMCB-10]|nr:hypothetical protein [Oscillatoria princeps RMCB-10]
MVFPTNGNCSGGVPVRLAPPCCSGTQPLAVSVAAPQERSSGGAAGTERRAAPRSATRARARSQKKTG